MTSNLRKNRDNNLNVQNTAGGRNMAYSPKSGGSNANTSEGTKM